MTKNKLIIREADADDLKNYRKIRLESLKLHPEAFGRDFESENDLPLSAWKDKFKMDSENAIFIAEIGKNLVGMSGIRNAGSVKTSHNAGIWGVYVANDYRNEKVGEKLIGACVQWGKTKKLYSVKLAVTATNIPAIRLYAKCGFQVYGIDPKVIRVGVDYFDELMMVKML